MKSSSIRNQYLTEIWSPYPLTPIDLSLQNPKQISESLYFSGRIANILVRESGEFEFLLSQNGVETSFVLADRAKLGVFAEDLSFTADGKADSVLQKGDIVFFRQRQGSISELQLLVAGRDVASIQSIPNEAFLKSWSLFLKTIRDFFHQNHFTEVSTPSLVHSPGMEPFLESFEVEWKIGENRRKLHLPTSPELHIKKILSRNPMNLYEIKRCFRNNEVSDLHQPEFTMLEWYRPYSQIKQIAADLRSLIEQIVESLVCNRKTPCQFESFRFPQVFRQIFSFELTPETTESELRELCKSQSVYFTDDDDWNDLFNRLLIDRVEPWLKTKEFVFIFDFPKQQMSLAKENEHGWSDRFELYCHGVELANAFQELNDSQEQEARIHQANARKKQLGLEPFPVDQEFIESLKYGLPPTAGIAVGLERLFMALYSIDKIEEAVSFSHQMGD